MASSGLCMNHDGHSILSHFGSDMGPWEILMSPVLFWAKPQSANNQFWFGAIINLAHCFFIVVGDAGLSQAQISVPRPVAKRLYLSSIIVEPFIGLEQIKCRANRLLGTGKFGPIRADPSRQKNGQFYPL